MTEPTETAEVNTERPAHGGAVGRWPDGRVAFVRHALDGEKVLAQLGEEHAKFVRAEAVEILSAHEDRVSPPCPHAGAGKCGGCDLQHVTLPGQRRWKQALVKEHLTRIAGITFEGEVEAPPSSAQGSRSRLRCGVGSDGQLGLRRYGTRRLEVLDDCWIADSRLAPAFSTSWAGYDEVELRAIGDGEPFAVARKDVGDEEHFSLHELDGTLLPSTTSSLVVVRNHRFRVGPLSFWQAHRDAPNILTGAVLEGLALADGDRVCDLYSGVGLFALALAERVGPSGQVTAVESSPDAVTDLKHNVRQARQVTVRGWRVTPRAINDSVQVGDVVVLDPPRAGAGVAVIGALVKRQPRQVAYVSCDAPTLARDLKVLMANGYRLRQLRTFDLFPHTEHVELLAVLDAAP